MKTGPSFFSKVFGLGPWPYICLSVAIMAVGAVLQIWSGTVNNLGDGQTIFGVFSKIGGAIGLFGLVPLAVRPSASEKQADFGHFTTLSRRPNLPKGARPNAKAAEPRTAAASRRQVALLSAIAIKLSRPGLRQGRRAV
jgi:hypothetical protein